MELTKQRLPETKKGGNSTGRYRAHVERWDDAAKKIPCVELQNLRWNLVQKTGRPQIWERAVTKFNRKTLVPIS